MDELMQEFVQMLFRLVRAYPTLEEAADALARLMRTRGIDEELIVNYRIFVTELDRDEIMRKWDLVEMEELM